MNIAIQLFKSILEISLFASAMIFLVLLIRAIAKDKINIKVISFLWLLVVLRLCIPGMLESPVHIDGLFPAAEVTMEQAASPGYSPTYENTTVNDTPKYTLPDNEYKPSGNVNASNNLTAQDTKAISGWEKIIGFFKSLDLWLAASILWIAGSVIVLLLAIRESLVFGFNIKRNSELIKDKRIIDIVNMHRHTNRIKREINISSCPSIHMPLVIGVFKPHILLPAHMVKTMERKYLEPIMLHEVCHIKRNDVLKNYAYVIAKAMHWFNPLVWIGVKKMKEDMEFSCDQHVFRLLGKEQGIRYCESLIEATRFLKDRKAPQFASSLCEKNSNLKKRVVKMINPQKKSKKAAMISLVLAMIMALTCFTTACQPTPETPVVVGKGDGKLKDTIEQTTAPDVKYSAPDTWQDELKWEGGTLTVKIDAAVNVPDVDRFPVVEIGPADFTQSEVDHLVDYFTDGAPLYEYDLPMTKAQYQERILEVQAELAMADNPDADLPPKEEIEALIADLQRRMQEAPESVDRKPVDGKLRIGEELDYETMEAAVYLGGEAPAQIRVNNTSDTYLRSGFSFENGIIYQPKKSLEGQQAKGQKMTPQEAVAAVDSMLGELGLTDMHAVSVATGVGLINNFTPIQEDKQGYIVTCKRFVEGIPVTEAEVRGAGGGGKEVDEAIAEGKIDEQQYAPYWSDGRIVVSIDDTGIRSFRWLGRGETGEVFNENVPLMPFDEIQKKFKQQIFATYGVDAETLVDMSGLKADDPETITLETVIDVYRVELGMVTIRQKDRMGSFVLVPAWTFFGKQTAMKPNGEPIVNVEDEMSGYISDSLLIINAIDGSVINQNSGF